VLVGGDGDDLLIGGAGRDLLVDGLASNSTRGGDSDQILNAGVTEPGHHELALQALLAEWTARNVQGGRAVWLDGSHFRMGDRAEGNTTLDVLTGGSDQDGFFSDGDSGLAT